MKNRRFTVVERAGYEGEQDVASDFPTWYEAQKWIDSHYSDEERDAESPECLHLDIRQDWEDEHGNFCCEYVY